MVTSAHRHQTTIYSDLWGNRLSIEDPDAGLITSTYTKFNELETQTDARGNVTSYQYDDLGRVVTKQFTAPKETPQVITYTYDENNGLGKVSRINVNKILAEAFTYDNLSRLIEHKKNISGSIYTYQYAYNKNGQLDTLTYPSGFAVTYNYTATGELKSIRQSKDNSLIYAVAQRNMYHSPTICYYGNGLTTEYRYSPYGNIKRIETGVDLSFISYPGDSLDIGIKGNPNLIMDSLIQDYYYTYDNKGLMVSRHEKIIDREESYQYDELDRLAIITSGTIGATGTKQDFTYEGNGNIAQSSAGTYLYDSYNKPHAVTEIAAGASRSIETDVEYNFFNQPTKITSETCELNLFYGADQQRQKTTRLTNGHIDQVHHYINKYTEMERDSTERLYHYIYGDNGVVALLIREVEYTSSLDSVGLDSVVHNDYKTLTFNDNLYYIHTDHLGSYCALTNSQKQVRQRNWFDPWGKYIFLADTLGKGIGLPNDPHLAPSINFTLTQRGFTGHEHYPELKIINMNGRLYDPVIARFFSPDKYVANSSFTQDFNRYSYARNNPLMYTDPSGEFLQILIPIIACAVLSATQAGVMASAQGVTGGALAKYIFGGAAVGIVSSAIGMGVGAGVAMGLAAANIGGIAGGAVTGAVSGVASGVVSGLGWGLLQGKRGSDLALSSVFGGLTGMGTGALLGGSIGMLSALANGNNVWLGRNIAMGRNAWSIKNTDLPATHIWEGNTHSGDRAIGMTATRNLRTISNYSKTLESTRESSFQLRQQQENWIYATHNPKKQTIFTGNMEGRGDGFYSGYVPEGHQLHINFDGQNVLTLSPGNYSNTFINVPSPTIIIEMFYTGNYPSMYESIIPPEAPFKFLIYGIPK